mmetsp:Transcript_32481/g.77591  ORF Transcript_32481/g.77591 Transcript_32481/m.77591 type:complete len:167 (-) Transcript_32481:1557-2057(-)
MMTSFKVLAVVGILMGRQCCAFMLPEMRLGRIRSGEISLAVAKTGARLIETTEEFQELLLSSDEDSGSEETLPVLALFTAPWCGPCRLTVPVVKEVMKAYKGRIDVVEIDTDELPDVAENAQVFSIPTILIYHNGKVMETILGCVAKNVLSRAIDKILEDLGMLDE